MEKRELGDALGEVVNYIVAEGERAGLDYTDDNVALMLAKRGKERFRARKAMRNRDSEAA